MSRKKKGFKFKKLFPPQPHDDNKANPGIKEPISIKAIKQSLSNIDDLVMKEIKIANTMVTIIYLGTLVETTILDELVYNPLNQSTSAKPDEIFKNYEVVKNDELPKLIHDICSGFTVIMFEDTIIQISTFSAPDRAIATPDNETTVMGPQDAFVESVQTNISMVKKRLRSPQLKSKSMLLGTETKNTVVMLYMENLANEENISRVQRRLENVEFHGFIGMPVLKQMLEDKPFSPFPQFGITVRTDNTVDALLNGKIIVMMNGSPEAAILPASFLEMFLSPEDYYNRWTTASMLRSLRLAGFFISIFLTSTYVSVLTFHPEMLPPQLLRLLAESRSQVPFPPVIEALIIELVIEVLREAGARMPTKIGQTIGIVGGIVIGTAAVEAGLASNILIVLVAVTALLSFIPPNYLMSNAIRFIRYTYIIIAGTLGMFGQMIILAWMFNHLMNLTSLSTPYMAPIIPRKWSDIFNSILRAPGNFVIQRAGIARAKKDLVRPLDEE
ncbi:spore germination protein [Halalkalibacter akibai]|uniref:Spore germination protein QA n=1 Tax=Halalkalibacter akibai (strain ATCC 43226 / DSM 21942 / CIP 109018 / JCM 9157 / 1139) TaxID=1236973 RepID=W4QSE4_HALA3|nr:spore germination protein [Halalkalibacter akibai]GAE34259.1 spore germination protein QA [Halalkalibacter akibai JCM 9157]